MKMKNKINGLIISSGFSKRMGKPKSLLSYNGNPFLIEIAEKLSAVSENIVAVLGYNAIEIRVVLENYLKSLQEKKLRFISNPDYSLGMFTSIQKGISELINSDWVIFHMVDQPDLPLQFYYDFIGQIDNDFDWIQPEYNLVKGHPVLIRSSMFNPILSASKEDNLRKISLNDSVKKKIWKCTYKQILTDIDTPEDYDNLLKQEKS